jgi:hypothetical protein
MDATRTTRQTDSKRRTNNKNVNNKVVTEKGKNNKRLAKTTINDPLNNKVLNFSNDIVESKSKDDVETVPETVPTTNVNANGVGNNDIDDANKTIEQSGDIIVSIAPTNINSNSSKTAQITNNLSKFRNYKKQSKDIDSDDRSTIENSDDDDNDALNLVLEANNAVSNSVKPSPDNSKLEQKSKRGKPASILGPGHFSLLHAYVRDTLFKKIKMLDEEHLESGGTIMQECLKNVKYHESMGNKVKFVNAVRSEIRVTMNSRIGYVKGQIGSTMKGA